MKFMTEAEYKDAYQALVEAYDRAKSGAIPSVAPVAPERSEPMPTPERKFKTPLKEAIEAENASTPPNPEKRSVATDALATLGTIIDATAKRDAIHIAVEPCIAAHQLRPGDHVGWVDRAKKEAGCCEPTIGIVDPFVQGIIKKGQRFWLLVYPRQITSLRHVWTHPAFQEEVTAVKVQQVAQQVGKKVKLTDELEEDDEFDEVLADLEVLKAKDYKTSKQWLETFIANSDCPDYETVIKAASGQPLPDFGDYGNAYENDGEYLFFRGRDAHGDIPPEFWNHVEVVTGIKVPQRKRAEFFSCSC